MDLNIDDTLQQGVAAHTVGNLKDAVRLYRAILQIQPQHPEANHNLGVIAVSVDKADSALPLFRTALSSNPKLEQFWISYIEALVKTDQLDVATDVMGQAKKQNLVGERLRALEGQLVLAKQSARICRASPPQAQIDSLLKYYEHRQFEEAEKLALSMTQEFPTHQLGWKALGILLREKGRLDESLVASQNSAELAPHDSEVHYNLGLTLQDLGRFSEAEAQYERAIDLKPDYAQAHNNLGVTLQNLGRPYEAEANYKKAIESDANFAIAFNNLGNALRELGKIEEAETKYRQAIKLKPDYAAAHNNLGGILGQLGKFEEAKACYRKAIQFEPGYAEAHRQLALLKTFKTVDEHFVKMLQLYTAENIPKEARCHLSFALAKAWEDLGDYKQAFRYYEEGNVLRKKLSDYDISQDASRFNQIMLNHPRIVSNSRETQGLPSKIVPIFIVGLPRSGTTLIEQIISSHSQVTGAGELNFVDQFGSTLASGTSAIETTDLLNFRLRYLKKLEDISEGRIYVTDKMPQNFLYLGLITTAFPEAKIIHVKRNPAAVCWANYKQYFSSDGLSFTSSLDDIMSYFRLYEELMDFWGKSFVHRIFDLDYEALVEEQESKTRQLIDYLDLDWETNCLHPENNDRRVSTASALQVRKKVYQGSSQHWRKYEPFLRDTINELLE